MHGYDFILIIPTFSLHTLLRMGYVVNLAWNWLNNTPKQSILVRQGGQEVEKF
jgi:hypothetical protein